jgi:hypothetical protein
MGVPGRIQLAGHLEERQILSTLVWKGPCQPRRQRE